jgi:hypothetical protein
VTVRVSEFGSGFRERVRVLRFEKREEEVRTSNVQHPTFNIQRKAGVPLSTVGAAGGPSPGSKKKMNAKGAKGAKGRDAKGRVTGRIATRSFLPRGGFTSFGIK